MAGELSQPITDQDHLRGRRDAPLQLVIYGDYECPYTRRAMINVRTIRQELGDNLVFVFRNYPLIEIHPHALHAAQAAEAAALQDKFWEMHDWLFDHQRALTDPDLLDDARRLGLDADRFTADRQSEQVVAKIEADVDSGEASGVEGTPTLFINGRLHGGSYEAKDVIDALKRSFSLPR
jgi:protein-disulfide isomerase